MSAIKNAADALRDALKGVEGLRVYTDPGASVDPPGALVGPPRLQWEAYCPGPTTAIFTVFLLVAMDERSLERLWEWVPLVSDALEGVQDAVTTQADPGVFNSGGTDLPCYEIRVEVSL